MVSLDHLEMKHRGHRAAPDLNILLPSQKERETDRGGQDEAGKGAKAQGHRHGNREVRAKPQPVLGESTFSTVFSLKNPGQSSANALFSHHFISPTFL